MSDSNKHVQEINELKSQVKLLTELVESLKNFIEGTYDLITRVDEHGDFTFVNEIAEKIFGIKRDQIIGESAFDFIHPDDREITIEWFRNCLNSQIRQASIINRQVNKTSASICHMQWTVNFHYDNNGKFKCTNGIAKDITKRIQLENEQKDTIDKLQKALNEVKILRGILPICSYCKKIRDDKGYWQQVEGYIQDHSEANFTHSACPDCYKKEITKIKNI